MKTALCFFLCLAALAPAGASGLDFTSSFENVKVQARPGDVVTRSFQLHLAKNQPRALFRSHVEDWWQSIDGAQSFYRAPGTLGRSCSRWITLNPVETAVEAGGTLEVRITAAVPATVRSGGYWCVLTVDQLPDPLAPLHGVAVRFLASVSTGIFISIPPIVKDVAVSGVQLSRRQVKVTLRNTGNAPVGVEGRIEVLRPDRQEPVASTPLPRVTILTEPFTSREVTADFPGLAALPAGRYTLRVVLDLGLDHDLGVQRELVIPDDLARSPQG